MSGVCYSYIPPIGYPCWECNDGDTTWCYVNGCEKVREYRERMKREEEMESGESGERKGRKLLFAV